MDHNFDNHPIVNPLSYRKDHTRQGSAAEAFTVRESFLDSPSSSSFQSFHVARVDSNPAVVKLSKPAKDFSLHQIPEKTFQNPRKQPLYTKAPRTLPQSQTRSGSHTSTPQTLILNAVPKTQNTKALNAEPRKA